MCYNCTIGVGYAVFVSQNISSTIRCCLNLKQWLWKCQRAVQKADFISASVSPLPAAQGVLDHSWEFSNACCSVLRLCIFFSHLILYKELGTGAEACFSLRNGTSHLMHCHTLTFNHLNSMLLLLSLYYCYLSPTWPLEKLHRRAESLLRCSL